MQRMLLLATLVLGFGCSEEGPESFASYQACFDDFYDTGMGLPVADSLLECCLSHPINDQMPACGASVPDCINYLTANLSQTSASTVEVNDACNVYADQL